MPTEVIHDHTSNTGNNSANILLTALLIISILFILIFWGIPAMRANSTMPTTPSVQIPGKVDVNINKK